MVGVGAVEAGCRLAAHLADRGTVGHFERVVFVGSAGAFPDCGVDIGDAVAVREARMVDGYDDAAAYLPGAMVSSARASIMPPALPAVIAYNRVGISQCAPPAATEPTVENMEVFGVLRACQLQGVDAGALLAVSNLVGGDAHAEWLAHAGPALDGLRARLRELLYS